MSSSRKDFWILSFMPFSAAMAASGTLIPLFIISATIGGTASDIGIFSAISSLVSLPLAFLWGKLTDDSGKRKIFILIAFLSGLGVLLGYSFATSWLWVLILSITSGLLLGAGDTAKNMYIFDNYPIEEWEETISKYSQRSGIGACLGMVFGGLFQMFFTSYSIFFMICAILCGVSAIIGFLAIKDISKDNIKDYKLDRLPIINSDLPVYSSLLQVRNPIKFKMEAKEGLSKSQFTKVLIMFFLAAFSLFLASNLTFTPLSAYMSQNLSIPDAYIFWIFLGYYIISVVGYTFAGNWIDKKGNRKILYLGLIIRIGVYGAFAIFAILFTYITFGMIGSFITVIILLVFAGISFSLMNVALQNILPRLIKKNVGEILALYSIIVGVSAIIGSFCSGFIAEVFSYFWLFLFSIIFAVIAGIIYLKTLDKNIENI